jgi:peptidoglycan/LPS O-acetylase OafA/YrhL
MAFIGKYSFPIFLIHLIVLYKLPLCIKFENTLLNYIFLIITFILSILVPIVISKSLMKISDNFKYIGLVK